MFKFFKYKILPLIYPDKCVFCEKITQSNILICPECEKSIKISTYVKSISDGKRTTRCISPFKYKGEVKGAVWRFKFGGCKNYAEYFSEVIFGEVIKNFSNIKFHFISAVPLSRKRQRQRGYNQSRWLAEALSEKARVPYRETLVKIKDNLLQHELLLSERMQNVIGAYGLSGVEDVKGKNILLCDDIMTTGNTLKECIKVLKRGGAKNIVCCTIAYV